MTFKITKNDVGRTAITRSGESVVIHYWHGETEYPACARGVWYTSGGSVPDAYTYEPLVAWADEQDQGERTPKKEVPGGPSGMSLRDWFAGQVVSGICEKHSVFDAEGWQELAAWNAYCMADAMIAARDKGDDE